MYLRNGKITKKENDILEKHFNVIYDGGYDGEVELEAWTDGGVDMLIEIDLDRGDNIADELEQYIENFEEDMDYEIDIYRENETYRKAFTIRESIADFEDWVEFIQSVIKELKESE